MLRHLTALALLALVGWSAPGAAAGAAGGPAVPPDFLFARLTTERRELFLQEFFDVRLSVYSRGLTMGRETAVLAMETPGLNVLPFRDLGTGRETIDGKGFDVHRFLGRAQAIAAGTVTLQPQVRVEIVFTGRAAAGAPGGASPGTAEIRRTELRPPPLAVEVRPLPEAGKPEEFAGAVGSFTFSASARPAVVAAGEPVTLTMEIRGRGNIEALAAPSVRSGDGFTAYEPKLIAKEVGEDRSRGRAVFEQILIPRSPDSTPLPAVRFSYFDPAGAIYRTLTGGPFPLAVTPAPQPRGAAGEADPSAAKITTLTPGTRIAGLKPDPGDWEDAPPRPWRAPFWFVALQFVPPVVLAALYFAARHREERALDVVGTRRRLAPEAARAGVAAAEEALRRGDPARFHDALWEALSSYFRHRLGLSPGEVCGEAVTGRLARAGLDSATVARLSELFALSERERFSRLAAALVPLAAPERQRLDGLLREFGRLLEACERLEL